MTFTSEIRLQRHFKKAHPPKKEQYKQEKTQESFEKLLKILKL